MALFASERKVAFFTWSKKLWKWTHHSHLKLNTCDCSFHWKKGARPSGKKTSSGHIDASPQKTSRIATAKVAREHREISGKHEEAVRRHSKSAEYDTGPSCLKGAQYIHTWNQIWLSRSRLHLLLSICFRTVTYDVGTVHARLSRHSSNLDQKGNSSIIALTDFSASNLFQSLSTVSAFKDSIFKFCSFRWDTFKYDAHWPKYQVINNVLEAFSGNVTSAQICRKTSAELPGDDSCSNDFARSAGGFKNSYAIFLK